jgi:hypothetical protein
LYETPFASAQAQHFFSSATTNATNRLWLRAHVDCF